MDRSMDANVCAVGWKKCVRYALSEFQIANGFVAGERVMIV